MRLRSFGFSFAVLLGGFIPCFAQQLTGPATSGNSLERDGAATAGQSSSAETPAAEPEQPAVRPQGTLVRPKDGVQHADLDRAWAEYDVAIATATEDIKDAIAKQFEAATTKGDLNAAEKWQAVLEKFEKAGEFPTESQTKAAVAAAVADCKKAREELTKAYESVVKSLTMGKRIAEAKAARDELRVTATSKASPSEKEPKPSSDSKTVPQPPASTKQASAAKSSVTIVGKWRWNSGRVLTFLPNGTTDQGHSWSYDKDTKLYRFSWNAVGELSQDGQTITEITGEDRHVYTRVTDK